MSEIKNVKLQRESSSILMRSEKRGAEIVNQSEKQKAIKSFESKKMKVNSQSETKKKSGGSSVETYKEDGQVQYVVQREDFLNKKNRELKEKMVHVVPWYNVTQFQQVYACLFCPEHDKQKWAIEQIDKWDKNFKDIPAPIIATRGFISATLYDNHYKGYRRPINTHVAEHLYAGAIIRFVALIVDKRKKGEGDEMDDEDLQRTLIIKATKLGVPQYIIELRNQFCHSVVPSLPLFREGARLALDYLKKTYWEKECSSMTDYRTDGPSSFMKINLREAVLIYIMCHKTEILQCVPKVSDKLDDNLDELDDMLHAETLQMLLHMFDRCLTVPRRRVELMQVLASKGVFIPRDEQIKAFTTEAEYARFETPLCEDSITPDTSRYTPEFLNYILPDVPFLHTSIWYRLVLLIHLRGHLPLFMKYLLLSQPKHTIMGQKLLISWIMMVLHLCVAELFVKCDDIEEIFHHKDLRGDFYAKIYKAVLERKYPNIERYQKMFEEYGGIIPEWHELFLSAVSMPNKYTPYVLPFVLSRFDMDRRVRQRIMNLVAIFLGQTQISPENRNGTVMYTAKDLKAALEKKRALKYGPSTFASAKEKIEKSVCSFPPGYVIPADEPDVPVKRVTLDMDGFNSLFKRKMDPNPVDKRMRVQPVFGPPPPPPPDRKRLLAECDRLLMRKETLLYKYKDSD